MYGTDMMFGTKEVFNICGGDDDDDDGVSCLGGKSKVPLCFIS